MEITFKFKVDAKVKMLNGLTGKVTGNALFTHKASNSVLVEYFDKNGAKFEQWFEEDELKAVK